MSLEEIARCFHTAAIAVRSFDRRTGVAWLVESRVQAAVQVWVCFRLVAQQDGLQLTGT